MKPILMVLLLAAVSWLPAQSEIEKSVLQGVQRKLSQEGGRLTFSDLHNDPSFSTEEKAFLERLYEIFFQIPPFLLSNQKKNRIPTRVEIAERFEISPHSVELLLRVMELDRRVPPLFERPPGGEITTLNAANLEAFISDRGERVKLTAWEGEAIPDFKLQRLEGGTFARADLLGQNSLLYFWFSGCPPCVRIAPILAELDREYRGKGLQIVGLNADQILEIEITDEAREDYLEKSETRYLNLHLDEETRRAFGNVNVYPTLFFVNSEGRVVRHMLNFQDKATLVEVIEQMLETS